MPRREGRPSRARTSRIEDVPAVVFCAHCSAERELASASRLRCPVCGEPTPDVIAGRELELAALEVSDRAAHC